MKKIAILTLLFLCFSMICFSQDSLKTKKETTKPKATYQVGNAKITVWEKKLTNKYGRRDKSIKNFKVEKLYKEGEEWKSTNYFNEDDFWDLKDAFDKAFEGEEIKDKEMRKQEKINNEKIKQIDKTLDEQKKDKEGKKEENK